jgi:hypothetical protein
VNGKATAAELRATLSAWERVLARVEEATTILSDHAKPDGPNCEETIARLYRALDSRGIVEDLRAAEEGVRALKASMGPRAATPRSPPPP